MSSLPSGRSLRRLLSCLMVIFRASERRPAPNSSPGLTSSVVTSPFCAHDKFLSRHRTEAVQNALLIGFVLGDAEKEESLLIDGMTKPEIVAG